MKKEQTFKQKCRDLACKINCRCQTLVTDIRYKEYLHNVLYDRKVCCCTNPSERRLGCSDIEKCHYKNRVEVIMILATKGGITEWHKDEINKILRTNVQYENLKYGYTAVIFNVNPHKM
ncbi:MAG: hypothetical protein IKT41_04710 [Clostridia bacterium]|nr:hypothetical protein [Clostridia bacterium]